jgi:hypothetical protein
MGNAIMKLFLNFSAKLPLNQTLKNRLHKRAITIEDPRKISTNLFKFRGDTDA